VSQSVTDRVVIDNKLGLHARPAMLFVEKASTFASAVTVCRCDDSQVVDGKSIMQMMMLAATSGTEIEISASGSDAQDAVAELVALVKSKFSEE
jgi:phosphocarrier protein